VSEAKNLFIITQLLHLRGVNYSTQGKTKTFQ
jgi:hypothetical protein